MLLGFLWLIGGMFVNLLIYTLASDKDEYMISLGTIIYGVFMFLNGLFNRMILHFSK